ncbi:ketosynthase [Stenotrophomonas sp. YIM B06876]|uniref:ketosynthase n=1 Tax=Stenotrophomonas sp. YIM B06876 TaxID=3060211 RepID=UPI00273A15FD|nr:ketosynthase [Stenotrophomonas sp. YIM B06876]
MVAAPGAGHGVAAALLRGLLLLAYPLLSHLASLRAGGAWAAGAMFSLVLLVLLAPLAQRRRWALPALGLCTLALLWLAGSPLAWMLLLAPPVVFPLLVAWGFARTLAPARVPLIGRIMRALYQHAGMPVTAALERYTRRLTAAWAAVLVLLAALNLGLAASAVPGGLLVTFGLQPWWPVSHAQWSWCANIANWGLIGGFFVLEYAVRTRLFPQRPDRNPAQFARQMAQLGPAFWRDLLR